MNIDHMTTYLEVVKRGSFSGAAKHLGLTQPGVSQQIRRLENDVGVPLLDRRERRVVMTGAGREFQRFASRVLAARSDFDEKLKDLTGQVSGRLALGASTVPGEFILPGLLAAFIALHPAVEASVEIGDTGNITDMVRTAECDLGFVGARVSHRGMKQEPFLEDELVLIVPSSHRLQRRKASPSQTWGRSASSPANEAPGPCRTYMPCSKKQASTLEAGGTPRFSGAPRPSSLPWKRASASPSSQSSPPEPPSPPDASPA